MKWPQGDPLVVRFPKTQAYGKAVPFNQQEMLSEYAGTGFYYRQANAVIPGICPEEYDYHVDRELTYTIESYMGEPIRLYKTVLDEGREYGVQLGRFFRKMDAVQPDLKGFGHLVWRNGQLEGEFQEDPQVFMAQEKDDFVEEWEQLADSALVFHREEVKDKLLHCLAARSVSAVSLTNQDTSPENLIIRDGKVHLIDPRPVVYSGFVFAGNHVNNYRTLFPSYHKAPRYEKHHFNQYPNVLHEMASGFINGYTDGSLVRKRALRIEHFLQLFSLCYANYEALQKEIDTETSIRMGAQQVIEERLPSLLYELETFEIE